MCSHGFIYLVMFVEKKCVNTHQRLPQPVRVLFFRSKFCRENSDSNCFSQTQLLQNVQPVKIDDFVYPSLKVDELTVCMIHFHPFHRVDVTLWMRPPQIFCPQQIVPSHL